MIGMKLTIELDIELCLLLKAALPRLGTDPETKTHHCRSPGLPDPVGRYPPVSLTPSCLLPYGGRVLVAIVLDRFAVRSDFAVHQDRSADGVLCAHRHDQVRWSALQSQHEFGGRVEQLQLSAG